MRLKGHEVGIAYNQGFRDGFIKGQEEGLKIARKMLELKPGQSLSIQIKDEKTAKRFMQQFKNNNAEGEK